MSYTNFLYHIVFRTKHRVNAIVESHEKELYGYLYGILKDNGAFVYRIGGMPDHIHILTSIPPTIAVSELMRQLKQSSSVWLKNNPNFKQFTGWSEGYAAFSYALRDKEMISRYIANQKSHHKVVSFEDEYRAFLIENGVDINEMYFLKD